MAGIKIPHWFKIKEQLLKIAASFPYLQYVGWDLIITDRSFKIIEGNHYTDVNLLQVHQPLLTDPRTKKFYQYHNIIK
ncbi:MAG: hypothetical protein GF353_03495 [Candidatus Lokiarchaeota archaeon]|nr:hypothetical protein [Candidatus Lokiarchaeota archaeon]